MPRAVHDNPTVVRAAVGGAVGLVNPGFKLAGPVEERLAVGENKGFGRSGDFPVESVVGDDFDLVGAFIGESYQDRDDLVVTVRAAFSRVRRAGGNAAHHHVVHGIALAGSDQLGHFAIHLGRATGGNRDVIRGRGRKGQE